MMLVIAASVGVAVGIVIAALMTSSKVAQLYDENLRLEVELQAAREALGG